MKKYSPEGFSKEIFSSRYAFTENETWEEACLRVATQMASAESSDKFQKYRDKFNEILVTNVFTPGGRIWYNSGRPNPQLLNCFVLGSDLDSKEGWANLLRENVITSMTGGGCGQDFSDVRPNGAEINGHRGICPGPIELMRGVNAAAKMVRSGGGRRAANMFSLDLQHPDVIDFLNAKLVQGELDMANISVLCKQTHKFIKAVKENSSWELSWKGKYKKEVNAKELWDMIVLNSWKTAEPGFLNWELVNQENNVYYYGDLISTNPCGEQNLFSYDCCCLGHLVLYRFIKDGKVDWHELANTIRLGVRFLDNVLSVNSFPLSEMKEVSQKLRRIGLGVTGLADMLILLGLKYASPEAQKFLHELFHFISKTAYESSVMLAVEKGAFPVCKPNLHVKSGYMKKMPKKIKALVEEHGIRNCCILTVAPTGTVSIISGNCSSGIEPIFSYAYWRNYWEGNQRKRELCFHPLFVKFMDEGKDVSHFISSKELSVRDHMETQKIIQQYIDSSISKTINLPKDYPIDEMSEMWLEYLPYLKGTTFYREGSRGYVDESGNIQEPPLVEIPLDDAIKLYKENKDNSKISEETNDNCKTGVCDI